MGKSVRNYFNTVIAPIDGINPSIYVGVKAGISYFNKKDAPFTFAELYEQLDGNITAILNKNDLTFAVTRLANIGILSDDAFDVNESCKIYKTTPFFNQELTYAEMVINILGSNPVAQIKKNGKPKLPSIEEEHLMLMGDLGVLAPGVVPSISQTCAQIKMYGRSIDDKHDDGNKIFDFLDGKVVAEINANGSATIGVYDVKKQKETQSLNYLNPKGKKKVCIIHCGNGGLSLNDPLKKDYPKYSLVDRDKLQFLLNSLGYDPTGSRKYIPENMINRAH